MIVFGKYFEIKYKQNNSQYYIKDLRNVFETFIESLNKIEVKYNFLLSIGENHIAINLGKDNDNDKQLNEVFVQKNENSDKLLNSKITMKFLF